jgi:hypothetical protein
MKKTFVPSHWVDIGEYLEMRKDRGWNGKHAGDGRVVPEQEEPPVILRET